MRQQNSVFSDIDLKNLMVPPIDVLQDRDSDMLSMDAQESKRFGEDTKHRGTLVKWMIIIVSTWLFFVLAITITNQILYLCISDTILATLLATTTVNVLGLSKIILGGLFGNQKRYKGKSKTKQ